MSGRTTRARQRHWGRSRNSVRLYAGRDAHVFAWSPQLGADSYGVAVRVRRDDVWTHWRLTLLQRNPRRNGGRRPGRFRSRRTLTVFEVARWRTTSSRGNPAAGDRVDLKSYVRLKAGPGGRQLSAEADDPASA